MNISLRNIDAVSAILKVEIEKNDYADQVDKSLRKMRQKAQIPGFRPGMAPLGYIKKIYGKQSMLDEVNNLVSKSMYSYLQENNVRVLADPIANETEQKTIDFDVDENFEFCFDIALKPEFDFQLTKDDTLTSYRVVIEDKIIDNEVNEYRRQYGLIDNADTVAAEDIVKGQLIELEEGAPKTGGIVIGEASLMPSYMKGKMEQKKFIGAHTGKKITFNPYKAYKGAEAELSSLLNIVKEAVKNMKSDFTYEIKEISHFTPAELNRDFFDKVFGPDAVKSESEFRDRVKDMIASQHDALVDLILKNDIRDMLIQKAADIVFADDILKRWLLITNKKSTTEEIEKDFPNLIKSLKYHFVKEKLVAAHNITVEDDDVVASAKKEVRSQFAKYGMYSLPDDMLDNYTKETLKNEKTVNEMAERALEEKLSGIIKETVSIVEQEVTTEEFNKILKEQSAYLEKK